ncbi:hypothetical protein CPAV1605_1086 [seawater metagenome]|uniref:Uncharacterized protein n=1 Tax=seawater metagenome TaxID=1561972 RepID=A0A5E8CLU7_9ZZZZ
MANQVENFIENNVLPEIKKKRPGLFLILKNFLFLSIKIKIFILLIFLLLLIFIFVNPKFLNWVLSILNIVNKKTTKIQILNSDIKNIEIYTYESYIIGIKIIYKLGSDVIIGSLNKKKDMEKKVIDVSETGYISNLSYSLTASNTPSMNLTVQICNSTNSNPPVQLISKNVNRRDNLVIAYEQLASGIKIKDIVKEN